MSFTPNRSNSGTIEPLKLLQESFSQASPLYIPLVVIATPELVVSVLNAQNPLSSNVPLTLAYAFLLSPLISGAGIYIVYRHLTTQTVDLAGAISSTFTKTVSLILSSLAFFVMLAVSTCALIIPGIFVGVTLWFSLYGVVVDDLEPIESLKQSSNLVAGRWWLTFGSIILPLIIILPISLLEDILATVLGGSNPNVLSFIVSSFPMLLIAPFLTTYYTKIYLRLKELAE